MTHDTKPLPSWRDESELGKRMAAFEAEQEIVRKKRLKKNQMMDHMPHHKKPRARTALPPNCDAVLELLQQATEPMAARDMYEPTGLRQYEVRGALNTLCNRKLVRKAGTIEMGEAGDRMHRIDLVYTYEVVPDIAWGRTT